MSQWWTLNKSADLPEATRHHGAKKRCYGGRLTKMDRTQQLVLVNGQNTEAEMEELPPTGAECTELEAAENIWVQWGEVFPPVYQARLY